MVAGGQEHLDNFREPAAGQPPVNPEVFHDRPPAPAAGSDRVSDAKVANTPEAELAYAKQVVTEAVNHWILQTGPASPDSFKVMVGALGLGLQLNAWTKENFGQIAACCTERAGQQQNGLAAKGFTDLAERFTKMANQTA
jgi:hypothetical protein